MKQEEGKKEPQDTSSDIQSKSGRMCEENLLLKVEDLK